jgi:hypothetical protein
MNTFEFERDPCYRVKERCMADVRIYSLMSDLCIVECTEGKQRINELQCTKIKKNIPNGTSSVSYLHHIPCLGVERLMLEYSYCLKILK